MPEPPPTAGETAQRMRAIAAELTAAGLAAQVHETREYVDVTATLRPAGQPEVEAIVDDDGYVELRFWHARGASPGQVSALITSAMAAITAAGRA